MSTDRIQHKYKVGDQCTTGQKITMILGQSGIACVYCTDDDNLRWDYHANDGQLPANLLPAVAALDSL